MSFQDIDQTPKRVCLGKIVAAHGVKGLVKILPYGDDISLLGGTLHIDESGNDTLSITLKNPLGKYILAEIEGITERNGAENIRGTELFISRNALPELEDGKGHYFEDLADLTVLDKEGQEIGKTISAQNFGASDLIEVQPKSGNSFYIPYVDDYIVEVDLEKQSITVQNYEDLIFE